MSAVVPADRLARLVEVLQAPDHRVYATFSVPDGPAGPPSGGLGVICSLSIPIVTICALIVLLIIASILNIIFYWLPYLISCRPKVEG